MKCLILFLLWVLLVSYVSAEEQERTWKNKSGKVIVAKLISFDEKKEELVIIKGLKEYTIKKSTLQLSKEDENYIKSFIAKGALANEAKENGIVMSSVEVFQTGTYHIALMVTYCETIHSNPDAKVPQEFYIDGNIQSRQKSNHKYWKAKLTLLEFIDVVRGTGGIIRRPVYKAENIRKAPPREIR